MRAAKGTQVAAVAVGVTGGAVGIIAVFAIFWLELVGGDTARIISTTIGVLLAGVATAVAAAATVAPKTAGVTMLVCAVLGLPAIGLWWAVPFVMLTTAGVLALI